MSDNSLKPLIITPTLTLDELGAVVLALVEYYQRNASIVPDAAYSLIQRLSSLHASATQELCESVLFGGQQ